MAEITYWKDIDIELNKKLNGDIADMTNESAIVNSLTNIFQTMQGERRMLPEFASAIHRLLFEPMDENIGSLLGDHILSAITVWETRIIVDNVNIVLDTDKNWYEVNVEYHMVSTDEQSTQTFSTILQAR